MEWSGVVDGLLSSGPFGVICAVLLWRDWRRDERDAAREKRRENMEAARIDADKALAVAMTLLSERIK